MTTLTSHADLVTNTVAGPNRMIVPFVACGDLSTFDSDMTYPVQVNIVMLDWAAINHKVILIVGCNL